MRLFDAVMRAFDRFFDWLFSGLNSDDEHRTNRDSVAYHEGCIAHLKGEPLAAPYEAEPNRTWWLAGYGDSRARQLGLSITADRSIL